MKCEKYRYRTSRVVTMTHIYIHRSTHSQPYVSMAHMLHNSNPTESLRQLPSIIPTFVEQYYDSYSVRTEKYISRVCTPSCWAWLCHMITRVLRVLCRCNPIKNCYLTCHGPHAQKTSDLDCSGHPDHFVHLNFVLIVKNDEVILQKLIFTVIFSLMNLELARNGNQGYTPMFIMTWKHHPFFLKKLGCS